MSEIKKEDWNCCIICKKTKEEIFDENKKFRYYSRSFLNHLKNIHNINPEEYFCNLLKIENPLCRCGICNKKVNLTYKGSLIKWKEYFCGRYKGTLKWSKEAKKTRLGSNNPMFGKKPWNLNKNKYNNESIKKASEKQKNKKVSLITREKQSISAKNRLIHGHAGFKHSEKTKEKLRKNTLRLISIGTFKKQKTKPFLEFCKILNELKISFEEEKILDYWCFDLYLKDYNIYIEIDGDYWHSNPRFYPNGPETKSQKINYTRDISKNNYCKKNNIKILRYWEYDILNNKESIVCNLKELLELKE